MMTEEMDIGRRVLDHLFDQMMIDEEWSVRDSNSFTWWGHRLAQKVWFDPPVEEAGFEITRVHAETQLLKDVPETEEIAKKISAFNCYASLSALIWYPEKGEINYRCSAYFHHQTIGWLLKVFMSAVALQAADAQIKVNHGLGDLLGGVPNESAPPGRESRPDMDNMLDIIEQMYAPEGAGESPWRKKDFANVLAMDPNPWVVASEGRNAMTAEFPFYGDRPAVMGACETALLQATAEEKHPQLGSGLLLRITLPPIGVEATADLACQLNSDEAGEWSRSHMLGAWCIGDMGITFVSFIPAALYRERLLDTMILSMAMRARWAKEYTDRLVEKG
ncbi:MAG: hypothetical protein P9M00_08775 [Candidatus Tritonobacter lacicola]|nr:hypothetical protein [Candidatus Tritonobacter lacicola]